MNKSISEEFEKEKKRLLYAELLRVDSELGEWTFTPRIFDAIDKLISQAITAERKELMEKLPKKMTMEAAVESNSDVGAGYTIGYNACRDEILSLLTEK